MAMLSLPAEQAMAISPIASGMLESPTRSSGSSTSSSMSGRGVRMGRLGDARDDARAA
ncbi:hypothetical protein HD597_005224 [Nonomuraea thailandensis]|uniref:Uncharacterized protein n=1 Tax=Nonomuraea thailandensis TaxID=1188745 RepID=A0A9X2GIK0_9ACTN|nr:hypothetical protein [Nonomuraea thailandensis]MCP2358204.1 hypothetical protein [Nonomuraea thailandensis]